MFYSVINFIINNQAHPRQDRADPQNIVFVIDYNRYIFIYINNIKFTIACDLNCSISSPNESLYFLLS